MRDAKRRTLALLAVGVLAAALIGALAFTGGFTEVEGVACSGGTCRVAVHNYGLGGEKTVTVRAYDESGDVILSESTTVTIERGETVRVDIPFNRPADTVRVEASAK
ncbi:MAG: hypothetical protein ABEJ08_03365 [Halobacteriaceae archaeon]